MLLFNNNNDNNNNNNNNNIKERINRTENVKEHDKIPEI